jgi:signal transduction histidine kinase
MPDDRQRDAEFYRRGELITAWARATSVALAVAAAWVLSARPEIRFGPLLALAAGYAVFAVLARWWLRRRPDHRRRVRLLHDVADALTVGAGAALTGGLHGPIWVLIYVHVVAVSTRGGLAYAMAFGALDALIMAGLTRITPDHPEGHFHAAALLFCAFMGGITSSYLHDVQRRLGGANLELGTANIELARTAARLAELDRLRSQYLNNVSHEFRTPLTVIRGYAEHVMQQGPPEDGSLPDVMRVIVESCDQIIDMVDTLFEVSRVEQDGERGLDRRPLDFRAVVMDALDPMRLQAAKKAIDLAVEVPSPLPLRGDPHLLDHVVRKLVDNALKYGPPGSTVRIGCGTRGSEVVLQIEDQGSGIAPEHVPRIFEKFYMADGGLNRRTRGAGLGLYLAREVVRLHGGSIAVESQPGAGSTFTVRLPSAPRAEGSA